MSKFAKKYKLNHYLCYLYFLLDVFSNLLRKTTLKESESFYGYVNS